MEIWYYNKEWVVVVSEKYVVYKRMKGGGKVSVVFEGKNVIKMFGLRGNVYEVLKGIDFIIEEGEFVGIMGLSGVGKMMLMNIFLMIDCFIDGEIWI